MNDLYLKINGRVFVKTACGLREIKDEENVQRKLVLENLTEILFDQTLEQYSYAISDLKKDLDKKKKRLSEARKQSNKKSKLKIIGKCILTPFLSAFMMTFVAYSSGVIDQWYNFIEAFSYSQITLAGTCVVSAIFLALIGSWDILNYIKAKRDVQDLEKEIPDLEREITDKIAEKNILESRSKQAETTTLASPVELRSLETYNERIIDRINGIFAKITDLKEARKALLELLQSDDLDDIFIETGFTGEEVISAKRELEKRFSLQRKQ